MHFMIIDTCEIVMNNHMCEIIDFNIHKIDKFNMNLKFIWKIVRGNISGLSQNSKISKIFSNKQVLNKKCSRLSQEKEVFLLLRRTTVDWGWQKFALPNAVLVFEGCIWWEWDKLVFWSDIVQCLTVISGSVLTVPGQLTIYLI